VPYCRLEESRPVKCSDYEGARRLIAPLAGCFHPLHVPMLHRRIDIACPGKIALLYLIHQLMNFTGRTCGDTRALSYTQAKALSGNA
jgi:hypothetical protein